MTVDAVIRTAQARGGFAMVARRGDPDAGEVTVKLALMDGRARAYVWEDDGITTARWVALIGGEDPALEADVDAALSRRADRDPDVWVIEIEDPKGAAFPP